SASLAHLVGKGKSEAYVEVKNAGGGDLDLGNGDVDEGSAACQPDVRVAGASTTLKPGGTSTYKLTIDTGYSKCAAASARLVFSIHGNSREFSMPLDVSFD